MVPCVLVLLVSLLASAAATSRTRPRALRLFNFLNAFARDAAIDLIIAVVYATKYLLFLTPQSRLSPGPVVLLPAKLIPELIACG